MVGKFEAGKDVVQEMVETGSQHVGDIVGIIARSVRAARRESAHGAEAVAGVATIVAGAVRDVAKEIGDWITDGIEMREAAKAARDDRRD